MNDQPLNSLPKTVVELNETPQSANVIRLLIAAKQPPLTGLALVRLLEWAQDQSLASDPAWMQAVVDAAQVAETDDPQATYWNLESEGIETAKTLEEAAMLLLSNVVDLVPAGTQPA